MECKVNNLRSYKVNNRTWPKINEQCSLNTVKVFTNVHDQDQWVDPNQDIKYHNQDHGKGPLENEFNDNSHQVGWLKAGDQTILALHKRVITHNTRYLGKCGNLVFANIDPLVGPE